MKQVEVICLFNEEGNIRPLKIRLQAEDETIVIPIKRLVFEDKNIKLGFNRYRVEFSYNNRLIQQDLIYNLINCKWYLK